MSTGDSIFALASGGGRSAVAVIRISGPAAASVLWRMAGGLPEPRRAALTTIVHPSTGAPLDRGLALWFPGPHSFTGEDCAELQVHGSRAVVAAVLEALGTLSACRLAEPGEFTRRAFLSGKLDLAAVEGLADLIDAETEVQRKQALNQLEGALGLWVEGLRVSLLDALAYAESAIDFADEGDVGTSSLGRAVALASEIATEISCELEKPESGERIREGFVVTLAGPPNAGKSTLLNALVKREAAIVSPHPGTTRDPIAVDLDLGGYAVTLIDTAGIRDSTDPVEIEGIARARARAAAADLVLWMQEATEAPAPPDGAVRHLWTVGTKADLFPAACNNDTYDITLSAITRSGLEDLSARIQELVAHELVGGEVALVTRFRHRKALESAALALRRTAAFASDPELVAEELRAASASLGQITGRIDTEEVLGAIFARFCIGK